MNEDKIIQIMKMSKNLTYGLSEKGTVYKLIMRFEESSGKRFPAWEIIVHSPMYAK